MSIKRFDWLGQYRQVNSTYPATRRKPLIGITGNYSSQDGTCCLNAPYYQSILAAGGTPVIIPPHEDVDAIVSTLDSLDGLVLSGGADMNPLFVGEQPVRELHGINAKRDLSELLTIRFALDRQIPILGICRGIQMLACVMGGSIYQDIHTQHTAKTIRHSQDLARNHCSHTVSVAEDSLLHRVMGETEIAVNSFHHQAVSDPGPHLRACAWATDGIIEAVESTEHKSILGVQWHPECLTVQGDDSMLPLFRWLVGEADSFAEAKRLHDAMLSLDSHCDTPMYFIGSGLRPDAKQPMSNAQMFAMRGERVLVDLHKMNEGRLDASIMVAYLPQGERDDKSLAEASAWAGRILDQIEEMVNGNRDGVAIARTPDDLYAIKAAGKRAIMLGIENGYAIGRDLSLVEHFRNRGVVYMTLCHNGDNDICDSARKGNEEHGGLSDFGREVVREMNRVGMMVDMSHAHEKSFWDALEVSTQPIVCSHSSCKALCDHPRNLTDEQMRALAQRGGVMQITAYEGFLVKDGPASVRDFVRHINHAVRVMGIDHVGIGTDFDGDGGVSGFANASEVISLTRLLRSEGYSPADIRKLWGENFLRVMRQVQGSRE